MLPVSHSTATGAQGSRLSRKTRVVSCRECHRRKQKCDRESPCNQCILRKVENLCHYASESRRRPNNQSSRSSSSTRSVPTIAPLPQSTSGNPVPTLHFQSTASQLLPYQRSVASSSYYSISDPVSPFYAAAAAGLPTQSVPISSSTSAFETTDGATQLVALAQNMQPPISYHNPDESQLPHISGGASDPGSASTASDGADDDYENRSWTVAKDDERADPTALVESLGYFRTAPLSIAQDLRELSHEIDALPGRVAAADLTAVPDRWPSQFPKSKLTIVSRLLRTMPPQPYADLLVTIFFQQANFYQVLNEVKFGEDVKAWWELHDRSTWNAVETACLMFRVLASALYFLPAENVEMVQQIDSDICSLARDYHAVSVELADMLPDSYGKVAEYVLRAAWYKYDLRMKDSWYCIGQAIRMAQEINLHIEPPNEAPTFEREKRRRLWWLIYYWDRCLALTLSRPFMISDDICSIPMPLDLSDGCYYPTVRPDKQVTPYTVRLTSYHLGKVMALLDSDPQGLFDNLTSFVASLPPYLRPQDPDTSLDDEYPFLACDRNTLAATVCMVSCALYRRNVAVPDPMSFCLLLLQVCADRFKGVQPHQYRHFLFVYWNLEPSVLICRDILREIKSQSGTLRNFMIVGNQFRNNGIESENAERAGWDVWVCLEAAEGAVARLGELGKNNELAVTAHKVLKVLVAKVRKELQMLQDEEAIADCSEDGSPWALLEAAGRSEESSHHRYYSERQLRYQQDQSNYQSQSREESRIFGTYSYASGVDTSTSNSSQHSSYSIQDGDRTNNNVNVISAITTPAMPFEKGCCLGESQTGVGLVDISLDFFSNTVDSGHDLSTLVGGDAVLDNLINTGIISVE
ncbi:fungal-specific transcription factor domain-containing protein [Lipomyces orientalis]|uniref:Fungal-specific transcription factor domain-containing protein n=1 Tax=Lipomyces orientalis TaxID=1233043 RepID=A0ACC3TUG8_9ASCO